MPSLAKKRKTNHFGELTDIELNYLLTGEDMFNEIDQDFVRQKWNEYRTEIIERYKETNPGERPFMWWEDHPEVKRKLIGGKCEPLKEFNNYSFGCYGYWSVWDSNHEPVFESQADCLKRYGLSDVY